MAHRGFDEQMKALDALKDRAVDEEAIEFIRRMLANRSNFLVAKAARLAEDHHLAALAPDLIAAFERFFENAEKADPQCWAKNALSRALPRLDCRDKEVYLRGLHFHQMEPTWGGRSDSAGTLRANCAHALVACEGLAHDDLLLLLIDLLVDQDKSVRTEAIRAIARIGDLVIPVLRLRALLLGEDREVLSACFQALLTIQREPAIPFVARFLELGDDTAGEAAFALAETRSLDALQALLQVHRKPGYASEPWFASALLNAIALTRLPQATDYLIGLIERENREAPLAIEALARLASSPELRTKLTRVVEDIGSPRLTNVLREHLPSQEASSS